MTTHPSQAALRAFHEGRLPPDELLAVDDHVVQCAECRQSIGDAPGAAQRFAEELGGEHLRYEAMERHVDRRDTQAEREIVDRHVALCAACRSELEDLARFAKKPRRNAMRWGFLAAAAAAIVVAIAILREPALIAPDRPTSTQTHASSTRPVQVPRPIASDPFESLDPSLKEVATSLDSGTLVSAKMLASLRGKPEQQRTINDPQERLPRLLTPVGIVVEEDRPEFRWNGEANVRVQVFDREYRLVEESSWMLAPSWKLPSRLRRGELYRWQLLVRLSNGEETIVPAPPAVAARFRVIDARAFEALTAARDSGALLEAGLICMREGLVADGANLLSQHAQKHPESAMAARLAENARVLANSST